MVVVDQQTLAIADAAAGERPDGRPFVVEAEIQRRVLDAGVVMALFVGGPGGSVAYGHGSAIAAPDVGEADLLDAPVVQPEVAAPAAPNSGIDAHERRIQAVEADLQLLPAGCGRHVEADRRQAAAAAVEHLDYEAVGGRERFGLQPTGEPIEPVRMDRDLLPQAAEPVRVWR